MKLKNIVSLFVLINFASTVCAQGFYMEFKLTSKNAEGTIGSVKAYSQDGNSRMEMKMSIPNIPTKGIDMTTLILKDNPKLAYMINEQTKTYSENEISTSVEFRTAKPEEYEVTVVGKETVNGYITTHCIIKTKDGKTQQEMWTTKDIADFASFQKIRTKYSDQGLFAALEAKGAGGMFVRIKTLGLSSVQLDLVKAEKRNNPTSLFSLSGYKKGQSMSGLPANFDANKIQNMTPEERQKFMEEMIKQYSGGNNK
jgi:hypothetical protein